MPANGNRSNEPFARRAGDKLGKGRGTKKKEGGGVSTKCTGGERSIAINSGGPCTKSRKYLESER